MQRLLNGDIDKADGAIQVLFQTNINDANIKASEYSLAAKHAGKC